MQQNNSNGKQYSQNNGTYLNQTENRKFTFDYKFLISIAVVVALIVLANKSVVSRKLSGQNNPTNILSSAITPARAGEVYPMFVCPCCGQPLDKNKICCGAAKERIDYIDSLVAAGKSEEEIILDFVKKYGLNSFVDKQKKEDFRKELEKNAPAERPIIIVNPSSYDFGDVSQKKGIVTTFFEIRNEGKKDLVIDKLDTSCGCTSASIVYQGNEGPIFSMPGHGKEGPKDWQIVITAGEKAELKVYYDPNVHKDFRGAATREIYIFSNDPIDFEKKVQVELNQVD